MKKTFTDRSFTLYLYVRGYQYRDIQKVDGFSICQHDNREKHNFPVIMLTAKEEEIDKITCLTLGVDDYITKPFRIRELISNLGVLIGQHKLGIKTHLWQSLFTSSP